MRDETLPDLPTIGDVLPGYEATLVTGLGAPGHTPAEIIERLNKEVVTALVDTGIKAKLAELGNVPLAMTPADFGKLIADETEKWAKVIRAANIKAQ
jgi:tripartite-type tricarboxylate transporter receptor subunit TctC